MTNKKVNTRHRAMGCGEPVIEVISETERIFRYPDGLVVRETFNRPLAVEDARWLIAMVADLAPIIMANNAKKAGIKPGEATTTAA